MYINLKTKKYKISSSILSSNFSCLREELKRLEVAKVDMIHIDVMDGHFVPNISIGFDVIKSIRKHTDIPLDVHLMIKNPDLYIQNFAEISDIITVHYEAVIHIDRTLEKIKSMNKKAGIALLPSTSPNVIDYLLDKIDLILVMSVNPGFSGQTFINSSVTKIQLIKEKIQKYDIDLSVDGGINLITAKNAVDAGCNVIVSGSYIFENMDNIQLLRKLFS